MMMPPDNVHLSIEDKDTNIAPPTPTREMLYGLAGEVGTESAKTTEANPYACAMDFLTLLSADVGSDLHLQIGNTIHHSNLFNLHVGGTSKGRKGEALSLPMAIRLFIKEKNGLDIFGQLHAGGLSTREGLITLVHDGFSKGKIEFPPISDKRLAIVESEFSNVLHQSKRDGNTLSGALRDVWDGRDLKPLIKNNPMHSTAPHISLQGHITPAELRLLISHGDLINGFANRFGIFWAERDKLIPFPEPTPKDVINKLALKTIDAIKFGRGNYPTAKNSRPMILTYQAKELYAHYYSTELNKSIDGDIIDAILARRAPILLRTAMNFAITDCTMEISEAHVEAAMAWSRYNTNSAKYIFSGLIDDDATEEAKDTGREIMAYLKNKPTGATKTEISVECFSRNKESKKIDAGLSLLLSESPTKIRLEERPRADGKPGRSVKSYSLI